MTRTVLVLGASGHFGGQAARAFAAAGWTVRAFQRGTDMTAAAMGADRIVNALKPPNYHAWDRLIPQITKVVIAAGLASGATVLVPGTIRAYAYLPDMARAAVALGEIRATLPAFADIPFAGYALRFEDIATALERLTGQKMRLTPFMWWFMRLAGPFWELARELNEMRYLWETPHQRDPAPLAALLPDFRLTPLDDVLRAELSVLAPNLLMPQGRSMSAQTGR